MFAAPPGHLSVLPAVAPGMADAGRDPLLAAFPSLPQEIVHTILAFACRLPGLNSATTTGAADRSPLELDVSTTLSLTLVSREVYSFVAGILYDHVVITRPSILRSFVAAIHLRPALGRLVRSLWIGNIDAIHNEWWPLRAAGNAMVSSITDSSLLPRGTTLGQQWTISTLYPSMLAEQQGLYLHSKQLPDDDEGLTDYTRSRISYLLTASSWSIANTGVHPSSIGFSRSGWIGDDEWTVRVYQLQGRLDAILLQLTKDNGQWRPLDFYLSLPSATPFRGVDRFDHPLVYARSGATALRVPSNAWHAEDVGRDRGDSAEDYADLFHTGAPEGRVLHYNTHNDSTIGGILNACRSLLAMLPLLQHFGCTGYLERAIAGWRGGSDMKRLLTVSLGPPPPFWSCALSLNQRSLDSVETLHIAGCMLFEEEAKSIAGHDGALPSLKRVRWTLWSSHTPNHPLDLITTIRLMLTSPPDSSKRKTQPEIQAHLDPQDVETFLEHAPSELKKNPRLKLVAIRKGEEFDPLVNGASQARDAWQQEVIKSRMRAGDLF